MPLDTGPLAEEFLSLQQIMASSDRIALQGRTLELSMRPHLGLLVAGAVGLVLPGAAHAADFDTYGAAPADFVAIQPGPNFVVELGAGVGMAPVYEGASEYGATFEPVFRVERLKFGFIDVGGEDAGGGFSFAPSISIASERVAADHLALTGLHDVDATYGLGARVGYEMALTDAISAEIYGAARWAFGGAEGLIGEAGIDVTATLTPQLEIIGGPVVNFASENYMDTYFGVTSAESAATGGRLDAFDAAGGVKSVGVKLGARYEFVEDTFVNLNASYASYVGDARHSPIVQSGSAHQFTVSLGLSRKFSF